jgi:maltooligosyltrehalose trehalohydrolase
MQVWSGGVRHGVSLPERGGCRFRIWAPAAVRVDLKLLDPTGRVEPMDRREDGYFEAVVEDAGPGTRYFFRIDSRDLPDPASRFQPEGVHGPSQVVDSRVEWQDAAWTGLPIERYILYELHVGTFTREGTFDAVAPHLQRLKDLGVTAIELMPVAQFPGVRNWGYDGAFPYAAQNSYGGPVGLRRLVDACHGHGLAVVLDVVYNHLGPEGNYLGAFGPYFTEKHKTPWGPAINFDNPESDEVRRFFVENALYWISECHVDALRLDAIHAIHDESAFPFLTELGEAVHGEAERLRRLAYVLPESALNDTRILRPKECGGMGLDAQWNDDFHHALRVLLTGDRTGYYRDFGELEDLAKAYREGFVYSGQYSGFRRRRHGNSSKAIPARQFIVFSQNHDQAGNRMFGERLSTLLPYEQLKLAAGAVLLSPFIPLLFMGEEYGEVAPFLYFVSHQDADLIEAVRAGRKEEFAAFAWQGEPPDPQDARTFERSKLDHELSGAPTNRKLLDFYRELIDLRKTVPPLASLSKEQMEVAVFEEQRALCLRRWEGEDEVMVLVCFAAVVVTVELRTVAGRWDKLLDSSDREWLGPGGSLPFVAAGGDGVRLRLNPGSVVVYRKGSEV